MKVLLTTPGLNIHSGGTSKSVIGIAEGLFLAGVDRVSILSKTDVAPLSPKINRIKCFFYKESPKEYSRLFQEADIIHDCGIWHHANKLIGNYALHLRKNLIISPHGMLEPWSLNNSKWKKKIAWYLYQKKILENCAGFHVTADLEEQHVKELFPKGNFCIAPNGYDPSEFIQMKPSNKKNQFLFLSRIHPKKGLENLLKVWNALRLPGWTLLIAGNGKSDYVDQIKALASKIDSVEYIGPIHGAEKAKILAESKFFILPSYSENFGIVVLEALASGTPVITTNHTPWDQLNIKKAGWCVDSDSDTLKATIQDAVSFSDTKYLEYCSNALTLAENGFAWKSIGEKLMSFYEKVLEAK